MTVPRIGHAAAALRDGRVLIVGGFRASTANSEVYYPNLSTFGSVAAISGERWKPSATLLADGRVLAAGGLRGGARIPTAEIYNPASGGWVATGSMSVPRDSQVAVRLNDGRVLVAGVTNQLTAELFDPVTGVFTSLGNMAWSAVGPCVVLPNGEVILVGLGRIQTFDPVTRTFHLSNVQLSTYRGEAVVLLQDGQVLIAGGSIGTNPVSRSAIVVAVLDGARHAHRYRGALRGPRQPDRNASAGRNRSDCRRPRGRQLGRRGDY